MDIQFCLDYCEISITRGAGKPIESGSSATRQLRFGFTRTLRLDAESVVHCISNALFAAEVSFGRLHRNVAQKELDLLKISARRVT
jgi:hypothetical protein